MSKRDDLIEKYIASNEKLGLGLSRELITEVTKALGPSIYNRDASTVSSSDDAEMETVKNNYLVKKLGLTDSPELMESVKEALNKMGSSNPSKYRALVYAMLCKKYGKQSVYGL